MLFATHDNGVKQHWTRSLETIQAPSTNSYASLLKHTNMQDTLVWLDTALPDFAGWSDPSTRALAQACKLIATSSHPSKEEGVRALEAGCVGYCHALSDAESLKQVAAAVQAGNVWLGRDLMQQLLAIIPKAQKVADGWAALLTEREREVARLAADGQHNPAIAEQLNITERTVKAHLAAIFAKLGVADRLQLALHIHGIR